MALSIESPLPLRLLAWMNERFPPRNAIFCILVYASAMLYGRGLTSGWTLVVSSGDVAGLVATYAFFLLLRVFDEHKDYELDCQNHPQRVLQSGLISLRHLKVVGAIAVAVQAAACLLLDHGVGRISLAWGLTMMWSLLMAREFFVHAWLTARPVLYALSHMLVMPLAMWWMQQIGAGQQPLPAPAALLAVLSVFSGLAYEVARKTKAPEEERPTVDTYTKIFGTRRAPLVTLALLILSLVLFGAIAGVIYGKVAPIASYAALAVAGAVAGSTLLRFRAAPSPKRAKASEGMVGLGFMIAYAVMLVALVSRGGITWR
jgi:4-hydroxybenzoate polyprenyltransferase